MNNSNNTHSIHRTSATMTPAPSSSSGTENGKKCTAKIPLRPAAAPPLATSLTLPVPVHKKSWIQKLGHSVVHAKLRTLAIAAYIMLATFLLIWYILESMVHHQQDHPDHSEKQQQQEMMHGDPILSDDHQQQNILKNNSLWNHPRFKESMSASLAQRLKELDHQI